jgi:hypothetical protein
METKLTPTNFCRYYILNPQAPELSPQDRCIATIASVVLGVIFASLIHLSSLFFFYDRSVKIITPKFQPPPLRKTQPSATHVTSPAKKTADVAVASKVVAADTQKNPPADGDKTSKTVPPIALQEPLPVASLSTVVQKEADPKLASLDTEPAKAVPSQAEEVLEEAAPSQTDEEATAQAALLQMLLSQLLSSQASQAQSATASPLSRDKVEEPQLPAEAQADESSKAQVDSSDASAASEPLRVAPGGRKKIADMSTEEFMALTQEEFLALPEEELAIASERYRREANPDIDYDNLKDIQLGPVKFG